MKNILLLLLVVSSINVFAQRDYSETLTNNLDVYTVKSEFERKASNYATSIMYKFGGENNLKYQYFDVKTGNYEKKIRGYMEDGKILGGLGLYVEWQDYGKKKCIVLAEMIYDMYNNSQNINYRILNVNDEVKKHNSSNGLLTALVGIAGIYGAYQAIKSDSNSSSYSNSSTNSNSKSNYVRTGTRVYLGVEIISWSSSTFLGNNSVNYRIKNKNNYDVIVKIELLNKDNEWKKDYQEHYLKAGSIGDFSTLGDAWQKSKDIGIYYVQ